MLLALLVAVLSLATAASAGAQPATCPEYDGYTCDEWVTDVAGVVGDDTRLEASVGRVVTRFGHEMAVVVVPDANGSPESYAQDLGNAWGVGDPARNDGIVVLVALEERRTEIETGLLVLPIRKDRRRLAALARLALDRAGR